MGTAENVVCFIAKGAADNLAAPFFGSFYYVHTN